MAIQIPDPGTGNRETGDNEYVLWSKVRDNFNDQSNAASRAIGTATGQVPLSEQTFKAATRAFDSTTLTNSELDANNFAVGTRYLLIPKTVANAPPAAFGNGWWVIETYRTHNTSLSYRFQIAYPYGTYSYNPVIMTRTDNGEWQPCGQTVATYNTTTAAGANVVVDSTGKLMRSTSSERYKDILADLVLTDDAYADAMSLAPIVYRSTADADNRDWHFYSFSAEALGAFDKAFVLWRQTEIVTDADGNMTEQPLDEPQAEGLNINALLAFSHAIAIKQDGMIKALTARVNELASKLEA